MVRQARDYANLVNLAKFCGSFRQSLRSVSVSLMIRLYLVAGVSLLFPYYLRFSKVFVAEILLYGRFNDLNN